MQIELNLLWIHDTARSPRLFHQGLLNNLSATVRHNQGIHVHFWLGGRRLCQNNISLPKASFHLHTLNEIPAFMEKSSFFGPWKKNATPTSIWARVDLARLLILEHMLQKRQNSMQVYADLDVAITPHLIRRLSENIDKFGLAVAGFFSEPNRMPLIENCLLGFSSPAKNRLSELIVATEAHLSHGTAVGAETGWQPLRKFVTSIARSNDLPVRALCIAPTLRKPPERPGELHWNDACAQILSLC